MEIGKKHDFLIILLCSLMKHSNGTIAQNNSEEILTISLYKVTKDGALIDWQIVPESKALDFCEFVYGPVSDTDHQQIFPNFNPDRHTVDLTNLSYNVTYHFHMVCYDIKKKKFISNTLNFTTGIEQEMMNYMVSTNKQKVISTDTEDPYPVSLDTDHMTSSNVILGAVCGIVGFLIINVTVVLAVRKYSHWQTRRRRIFEIQDRDYDGFAYLRDIE